MTSSPATATDAVISLAEALRERALPPEAEQTVRHAFMDAIACILAGAQSETGRLIASYVGDRGGNQEASIVGHQRRVPASEAALANGTAAHALDFDDIVRQLGHPSVVLVPALLAAGERSSCAGPPLIAAYGVGFEVMSRALRHLNPPHFARGWHATSTVGVLAATVAVAVLLQADERILRNAIGIAASSSSGLRKMYGSMVKPLHAGMAAHNAVVALQTATDSDRSKRRLPTSAKRASGNAATAYTIENAVPASMPIAVSLAPNSFWIGTSSTAMLNRSIAAKRLTSASIAPMWTPYMPRAAPTGPASARPISAASTVRKFIAPLPPRARAHIVWTYRDVLKRSFNLLS